MNVDDVRLPVLARDDDPNRAALDRPQHDLAGTLGDLRSFTIIDHGNDNRVLVHPEATMGLITFDPGSTGNVVICGTREPSRQPVVIAGHDNCVIIGLTKKFGARIAVSGNSNLFFAGRGSTCNKANIVLQGTGRSVLLGLDCMLSMDVTLRAADSHAIIDLETQAVVNAPESILLGAHCWLGEGSSVLKGVRIGSGTIIGSCALVTSDIPERSLAIGVPARAVRSNVSWTRNPDPGVAQLRELERLLRS
jgi:acetyltransferase-like isoleucine patch superfamily enzyme